VKPFYFLVRPYLFIFFIERRIFGIMFSWLRRSSPSSTTREGSTAPSSSAPTDSRTESLREAATQAVMADEEGNYETALHLYAHLIERMLEQLKGMSSLYR
jgi:hypothetical protein